MVIFGYSMIGFLEEKNWLIRIFVDNGVKLIKAWGELSFGVNDFF